MLERREDGVELDQRELLGEAHPGLRSPGPRGPAARRRRPAGARLHRERREPRQHRAAARHLGPLARVEDDVAARLAGAPALLPLHQIDVPHLGEADLVAQVRGQRRRVDGQVLRVLVAAAWRARSA